MCLLTSYTLKPANLQIFLIEKKNIEPVLLTEMRSLEWGERTVMIFIKTHRGKKAEK